MTSLILLNDPPAIGKPTAVVVTSRPGPPRRRTQQLSVPWARLRLPVVRHPASHER